MYMYTNMCFDKKHLPVTFTQQDHLLIIYLES